MISRQKFDFLIFSGVILDESEEKIIEIDQILCKNWLKGATKIPVIF